MAFPFFAQARKMQPLLWKKTTFQNGGFIMFEIMMNCIEMAKEEVVWILVFM